MRAIKFRGRHLCGQWYYGNLIIRETESPVPETPKAYKCVMIGDVEDGSAEDVEEDTVGQFTGLKDCKGNDIYEGDIIDIGNGEYSVVSYSDSHALFDLSPNGLFSQEAIIYGCFEVVGNIFDNLDLLK